MGVSSHGNGGAAVRPTSLYGNNGGASCRPELGLYPPDSGLTPEREPIPFDVNLVGAPFEVEQLINNIKQVAESFLYHWKTFPIGKLLKFNSIREY